jgi:hypothetical protein
VSSAISGQSLSPDTHFASADCVKAQVWPSVAIDDCMVLIGLEFKKDAPLFLPAGCLGISSCALSFDTTPVPLLRLAPIKQEIDTYTPVHDLLERAQVALSP